MAWTQPTERQTGDVITAAIWNQEVKDNTQHLHDRIEEMWVPCFRGSAAGSYGDFPTTYFNPAYGNEWVRLSFVVPDDFDAVEEVVVVYVTGTTSTSEYDLYSDYGGAGEAYNMHSEAALNQPLPTTANELDEIDVSGVLSGLAAGDYVGIRLQDTAAANPYSLHVIGLRFRYLRE